MSRSAADLFSILIVVVVAVLAPIATTTSTTSALLGLDVDTTSGSYVLKVGGTGWLQSGALRMFVNGEWHSTLGPSPANPFRCTAGVPNTDVTGGWVLNSFPNATDASCCAACHNRSGCAAWARSTVDEGTDPMNTCFIIGSAISSVKSTTRVSGFITPDTPAVTGTIVLKPTIATGMSSSASSSSSTSSRSTSSASSALTNGSDCFGSFTKTSLEWRATSSTGVTTDFSTAFRVYTDDRAVVFEQSILLGAKQTNYKEVGFGPNNTMIGELSDTLPFLHFPSFNTSHTQSIFAVDGRAGSSTWRGTFLSQRTKSGAPNYCFGGLDAGPLVVFESNNNNNNNNSNSSHPQQGLAVIMSPATHFKGAVQFRWEDDWVTGVSGEVTDVPSSFTHETIVIAGVGMTETVRSFGDVMQSAHNTTKVVDRVVTHMGYWTDNGAFYYGDAYPQGSSTNVDYNLSCCSKANIMQAKKKLDRDNVPIRYLQLDDWWYHGPHPGTHFHGVKCVSEWALPENTYPGGLIKLRQDYDQPFVLYGPYFCTKNQWNQTLVPAGADAGVPIPEESFEMYKKVFQYAKDNGAIAYEIDFMSELYLGIPEFRRTLDASTVWLTGMTKAAEALKMPIQLCMMQPSDLLASLNFDYATNGRASGDYAGTNNWEVGGPSLLFWAFGMAPSKDNFWSSDGQIKPSGFSPDNVNSGTNGELNAIIATMSTGPVGSSDGEGAHNTTRLLRTCNSDGLILKPRKPMTPIDATYTSVLQNGIGLENEREISAAAVWTTYSEPVASTIRQYHVLAVDVAPPFPLRIYAADLYPVPNNSVFAVRDWHRGFSCDNNTDIDANASGCVAIVSTKNGAPLLELDAGTTWPNGTHTFQLSTITPLTPHVWQLLGELDKFVCVSDARFENLKATQTSLTMVVKGAPDEVVVVTALKPVGDTWRSEVTRVTITHKGFTVLRFF